MRSYQTIWLLGSIWTIWENAYFGWNWTAHSDAEIICDGMAFAILALSYVAKAIERHTTTPST